MTKLLGRALWLVTLGALLSGCLPGDALRLVDSESGEPLAKHAVSIFIDDGVRCVTTPCPTTARTWRGRTDSNGEFRLPSTEDQESMYLRVAGYQDVAIDSGGKTLRLRRVAPPKQVQTLRLHAGFTASGDALELEVMNPGPRALTVVKPRSDALGRYAEWGGWHLLVKHARGFFFLPEPMPGPYVAATDSDLMTLKAGDAMTVRLAIGHWRRVRTTDGAANGPRLDQSQGKLTARVRWSKLPAHLKAAHVAPRMIASARFRRGR